MIKNCSTPVNRLTGRLILNLHYSLTARRPLRATAQAVRHSASRAAKRSWPTGPSNIAPFHLAYYIIPSHPCASPSHHPRGHTSYTRFQQVETLREWGHRGRAPTEALCALGVAPAHSLSSAGASERAPAAVRDADTTTTPAVHLVEPSAVADSHLKPHFVHIKTSSMLSSVPSPAFARNITAVVFEHSAHEMPSSRESVGSSRISGLYEDIFEIVEVFKRRR